MNAFELRGEVVSTDQKPTTKGGHFWLVEIDTGAATVTVPVFRLPPGGPLQVGERIRVEGSLANNDRGYLQMRNAEITREHTAGKMDGPRMFDDPPPEREPVGAGPWPVDDDLPF